MIASVVLTSHIMPEILCYVSYDDTSYDQTDILFSPARFVQGPRLVLSDIWNVLASYAHGDIFMQAADDILFRTMRWDVEIEKAFAESRDKILLVFGNDKSKEHRGKFATLPFVHRRWYETVGYFTGPGFAAWFSDSWPNDVADMIGRKRYLPSVVIEHMHSLYKKAPIDETYKEGISLLHKTDPKRVELYRQYDARLSERKQDAAKLRKVMVA